jgi:hypothetical protein
MYDACIQFSQSSGQVDLNEVLGSLLPSDNRYLLEAIILLFRSISSEANLPITKMEKRSLAICIAPSILKPPSENKGNMLNNVQHSITFIGKLIEQLEIKNYKLFEDSSAVATFELNTTRKDFLQSNLYTTFESIIHEEKEKLQLVRANSSSDLESTSKPSSKSKLDLLH